MHSILKISRHGTERRERRTLVLGAGFEESLGPNNSVNTLSAAFFTSSGGAQRSLVACFAAFIVP